MNYSSQYPPYIGVLSSEILQALTEIQAYFDLDELRVLQHDEDHILIPIIIPVSIPPNGTVGGIDIRAQEPCLVRISLNGYPHESPTVISDREDFPRRFLGHLYVSKDEKNPGPFCLVRNDPHEWFANRSITGVLDVTHQWFFKAAIGKLNEDGDEFDPTRLEGYRGYHIYKYVTLLDVVAGDKRLLPDHPFAVMLSCIFLNEDALTYKTIYHIPFIQLEQMKGVIEKINGEFKADDLARMLMSIVVWSDGQPVESEYCTAVPQNYGELKIYFQVRGIQIESILQISAKFGIHNLNGIPIIHAMRRPRKMIGYKGEFEFINFVLLTDEDSKPGKFPDETPVRVQSHTEPFTRELAEELSGEIRDLPTLYVGGGSLGSKLVLHEIRAGNIHVGVADQDKLMQHNLVRHALFNESVGMYKAQALIRKARNFFVLDKVEGFKSYPIRIHQVPEEELNLYPRLIDSTASLGVQNWLTTKQFAKDPVVIRTELAHQGQLGLVYVEGKGRNPRIDDLVNLTYYRAVSNPVLEYWRKYDSSAELMNLNVGLGCSSPTTVMADDTISFHASIFSRLIQNLPAAPGDGLLFRSVMQDKGVPAIASESEIVPPFEVYACCEGSGWEIRLVGGSTQRFLDLCHSKGNIETGGILIGMANSKTRTIHVFDIITEPQDSKGTCSGFTRGTKGMPALVDEIKEKTGDMVGYIGEWHTHPMNLERLSSIDRKTIGDLKVINRRVPIPTLAVIVTTSQVLPFVFA